MTVAPIGLIANPASGKDIRRLVARASTFDNAEKANIVRRLALGALATGAERFIYLPDDHQLVASALHGLPARAEPLAMPIAGAAEDSERAARLLAEAGCAVVVSLGGDGTNRAIARGWRDAPLIALSTGTNNVFPRMIEGTVAGTAAALIATGRIPLHEVAARAKRCAVQIEDEEDDLALIDAALVEGAFAGSRAIWDGTTLRAAVLTRAEPDAVGLSAIGGVLAPLSDEEDAGLLLDFRSGARAGTPLRLRAPLAPGLVQSVTVHTVRRLALGEAVVLCGPGMLALDGERERRIGPGQTARLTVLRDGPRVIDVRRTLLLAAQRGAFVDGQCSRREPTPEPRETAQPHPLNQLHPDAPPFPPGKEFLLRLALCDGAHGSRRGSPSAARGRRPKRADEGGKGAGG